MKLRWIEAIKLALAPADAVEKELTSIRFQAYPPDMEEDGEMDARAIFNLDRTIKEHEKKLEQKTRERPGFLKDG